MTQDQLVDRLRAAAEAWAPRQQPLPVNDWEVAEAAVGRDWGAGGGASAAAVPAPANAAAREAALEARITAEKAKTEVGQRRWSSGLPRLDRVWLQPPDVSRSFSRFVFSISS
jgi:hypothetical protein